MENEKTELLLKHGRAITKGESRNVNKHLNCCSKCGRFIKAGEQCLTLNASQDSFAFDENLYLCEECAEGIVEKDFDDFLRLRTDLKDEGKGLVLKYILLKGFEFTHVSSKSVCFECGRTIEIGENGFGVFEGISAYPEINQKGFLSVLNKVLCIGCFEKIGGETKNVG